METSTYLLAYFDILGYKSAVNEMTREEEIEFIKSLIDIIDSVNNLDFSSLSVSVHTFSDNYAIAIKISDNSNNCLIKCLFCLLNALKLIQQDLIMKHGLFVRGSIVKGDLFVSPNFIHGKALIKAHSMENSAVYPRIVIENSLIGELKTFDMKVKKSKDINNYIQKFFVEEDDSITKKYISLYYSKQYFIDYDDVFCVNYLPDGKDNYDMFYLKHSELIILNLCKNFGNKNVTDKYLWLYNFHQTYCPDNYKMDDIDLELPYELNDIAYGLYPWLYSVE